MRKLPIALLWLCGAAVAASLHFQESGFVAGRDGKPAGWTTWSARPETAPRAFVDPQQYRTRPGSLAISGNSNVAEHGGWERRLEGVDAGAWYRFVAYYRAESVPSESWQVVARLDWRTADNRRAGEPDYVYRASREGAWTKVSLDTQSPPKQASVGVQLDLSNAPQATVWWDDIALDQVPDPGPRKVTVASINLRPGPTHSSAESVRRVLETVEAKVPGKTDVILLPEGITVVGTGKPYPEVAETIPGPTTARLGEVARQRASYIAAGIYEREGAAI